MGWSGGVRKVEMECKCVMVQMAGRRVAYPSFATATRGSAL
jgi:hypothetical protein